MSRAKLLSFAVLTLALSADRFTVAQNDVIPETPPPAPAENPELSPEALEALVAGIAFYSDETIEKVLAAAMNPAGLHEVAGMPDDAYQNLKANIEPSIQYLRENLPQLLKQLDEHLPLTARLGAAAQYQLVDVWRAIDRVRAKYNEIMDQQAVPVEQSTTTVYNSYPVYGSAGGYAYGYPVYGYGYGYPAAWYGYLRGLYTAAVIQQLYYNYPYPYPYPAPYPTTNTNTTKYIGPNGGTATATTTTTQIQGPNGQAAAGTGTATVQTPGGTTAKVQGGAVTGSTTQGNTTTFGSAGRVNVTTSNGGAGQAVHVSGGTVTQNADGSTTTNRSGTTSFDSTRGSTDVQHTATRTNAADGSVTSYQGSTTIDSTRGDASINTQAGGGQVTSTVTTDKGTKTFTAGDGNSQPSTRRPDTVQPSANSRLASAPQQNAFQNLSRSWGDLDRTARPDGSGLGQATTNRSAVNGVSTRRPEALSTNRTNSGTSAINGRPGLGNSASGVNRPSGNVSSGNVGARSGNSLPARSGGTPAFRGSSAPRQSFAPAQSFGGRGAVGGGRFGGGGRIGGRGGRR